MDPNETLRLILAATDADEAQEHCENLADWLRKGGFAPRAPETYWHLLGTTFSILAPFKGRGVEAWGPGDSTRWRFIRWEGDRAAECWTLPSKPDFGERCSCDESLWLRAQIRAALDALTPDRARAILEAAVSS